MADINSRAKQVEDRLIQLFINRAEKTINKNIEHGSETGATINTEKIARAVSKIVEDQVIPKRITVGHYESGKAIEVRTRTFINEYMKLIGDAQDDVLRAAREALNVGVAAATQGVPLNRRQTSNRSGSDVDSLKVVRDRFPEAYGQIENMLKNTGGFIPQNVIATTKTTIGELGSLFTEINVKSKDAGNYVRQLNLVIDELGTVSEKSAYQTQQREEERVRKETELAQKRLQKAASDAYDEQARASEEFYDTLGYIRQEFPAAFNSIFDALYKADPNLLADPSRTKIKSQTDQSTGITRLSASYEEMDGAIKQVNIALDRTGKVLQDTSKRFNTFTGSLKRNMTEFFKWSLAIAIVYGPLSKLQELVQTAIKNQSELADVAVTLGKSTESLNSIFESAADIANDTATSIDSVIESYDLAFRATASLSSEAERAAAANTLLKDSIILTKLTSMDQAEATDTLAAALHQAGMRMDDGVKLIDKWVKVSRIANVDVETLATTFGIVGDAAINAGLGIDELNGLIAVVAATGITSARETGNAVRALVSGYTTDTAVEELRKYGISIKNAEDDTRDFNEVMTTIRESFEGGLINEDQLNAIGYAIGGGSRRAAQAVTAITNQAEALRVASESMNAYGEAQRAIDVKMETVESKTTKLGNSFQYLAQVIGTKGGILDSFSTMLTLVTGLVNGLSTFTSILGTAAPVLAGIGLTNLLASGSQQTDMLSRAASSVLGYVNRNKIAQQAAQLYPDVNSMYNIGATSMTGDIARRAFTIDSSQQLGQSFTTKVAPYAGGVMATAFMAGIEAAKGDWKGAGVIVGAGTIGTILGGNIGGIIGSTIATAIVSDINEFSKQATTTPFSYTVQQEEQAKEGISSGSEISAQDRLLEMAGGSIIPWLYSAPVRAHDLFTSDEKDINMTESDYVLIAASLMAALQGYKKNPEFTREDVNRLAQQKESDLGYVFSGTTKYGRAIEDIPGLDELAEAMIVQLRDQLYHLPNAEISNAEFIRRREQATTLGGSIPRLTPALTGEFGGEAMPQTEAVERLATILIQGSTDQIDMVNQLNASIAELVNLIDTAATGDTIKIGDLEYSKDEAQSQLSGYIRDYVEIVKALSEQIKIQAAEIPSVVSIDTISESDIEKIKAGALAYQESLYEQLIRDAKVDEKTKQELMDQAQEFYLKVGEDLMLITGIDPTNFQNILSQYLEDGIISSMEDMDLGIRSIDVGSDQVGVLFEEYNRLLNEAMRVSGGRFKENKDESVVVLSDKTMDIWDTDWTLLMLALEEITDLERKQVEGLYNLPSDGTFYVPWQAAAISPEQTIINNDNDTTINNDNTIVNNSNKLELPPELQKSFGELLWAGKEKLPSTTEDTLLQLLTKSDKQQMTYITPGELASAFGVELDKALGDSFSGFNSDLATSNMNLKESIDLFRDKLQQFQESPIGGSGGGGTGGSQEAAALQAKSIDELIRTLSDMQRTVTTNLNLSLTSTIQINLDGATLAAAMKRYFYRDLLRASSSSSTVTRSLIV